MNSIEELKRLAEQANPELRIERVGMQPVECPDGKTRVMIFAQGPLYEYKEVNPEVFKDTEHIAAFNPTTVLALIEDWEKMAKALDGINAYRDSREQREIARDCLQSLQFKKGE